MASKREVCEKHQIFGGWRLGASASLQMHHFQFGVADLLSCSFIFSPDVPPSYHRLTVQTSDSGRNYVLFGGRRFYLDEAW